MLSSDQCTVELLFLERPDGLLGICSSGIYRSSRTLSEVMESVQICPGPRGESTDDSYDRVFVELLVVLSIVLLCFLSVYRGCVFVVRHIVRLYTLVTNLPHFDRVDSVEEVGEDSDEEECPACTPEEVKAAWEDFYSDLSAEELHNMDCYSPK